MKNLPKSLQVSNAPIHLLLRKKCNRLKRNSFAYIYNAGGIPCKIDHGTINNKIKWDLGVDPGQLAFDPILITCFDGLIEEKHPYNFISMAVIKDLLDSDEASDKTIPIVPKLVWPLRTAL